MQKILIIDDEISVCKLLSGYLQKKGFETASTISGKQGLKKLQQEHFDVVLCDYRLGDFDGSSIYPEIRKVAPEAVVIFITGYVNLQVAIDLVKKGVYQYLEKPLRPDDLLDTIRIALSSKAKSRHYPEPRQHTVVAEEQPVLGQDTSSRELMKSLSLVGPTDYSVVIEGETGTGKESIARLLHQFSKRKNGPFIPIDCGSLSKEIGASELFGHERGAYTGAFADKTGAFELAEGGTIFLDEIANLSLDIQVMLLRAIQERKVRKLGSVRLKEVDVRIVVATNENLIDKVKEGLFREDLYYRINEFTIKVPPLRERPQDLCLLVKHYLEKTGRELDKSICGLDEEVDFLLKNYHWPGNIRELKNMVRRACLLTEDGERISSAALPASIREHENSLLSDTVLPAAFEEAGEEPILDLKSQAHLAEAKHIRKVLHEVGFNKTKAAELLNIDRKTLYQKLKRFELKV
ncbi:two-component system, NtrC family, response regulator HydG [Cyclobacterium lianum]|uniref:Two-component system, NtrC family, response regulator HydG n=1 Tax=Cyclobacterium lianum TaxID=388280 RepID=A0A1M7PJE9_9BACT|nr:sigma-54 dependent transcriptional regulator [Cyclobacterium lianum]SHN17256.1 two-component system, NtrC family, response regulator HydG [Cyclobacterium lianum]